MAINIHLLRRVESDLRDSVEKSPSDPEARQSLAFCLLLLATYAAGQESAARHGTPKGSASVQASASSELSKLDSVDLMRQHLKHMHVLKLLSPHASEQPWRLHSLSLGQLFAEEPDAAMADFQYQQALAKVVGAVRSVATEDRSKRE